MTGLCRRSDTAHHGSASRVCAYKRVKRRNVTGGINCVDVTEIKAATTIKSQSPISEARSQSVVGPRSCCRCLQRDTDPLNIPRGEPEVLTRHKMSL